MARYLTTALRAFRSGHGRWILVAIAVFFFLNVFISGLSSVVRQSQVYVTYFPREWKETEKKLILLWTPRFGYSQWHLPQSNMHFKECRVQTCEYTDDKARIKDADAVLFHSRALWNNFMGIDMPSYRAPHQVWVYTNMESLPHTFVNFKNYAGVFNWTFTVRFDADVTALYGSFMYKGQVPWNMYRVSHGLVYDPTKQSKKSPSENIYAQKSKFMAWTSSDCIDEARRQRTVQQLQQYFEIDTYGTCGDLKLECEDFLCEQHLSSYKFYLSLENAHCKDYLTEKFFTTFKRKQIPIVLGLTDYEAHAPPHSYISLKDFKSLKDMVDYIKQVDADPDLYNSYFWWHDTLEINTMEQHLDFCNLCDALHDKTKPAQVYSDLDSWVRNDTCQPFSVWQIVTRVVEGTLLKHRIIS